MHDDRQNGMRRLEIGLPYLLKHNLDHVTDIEKWIQRAKEAHEDGVVDDLRNVLDLSNQITGHFEAALSKLKREE